MSVLRQGATLTNFSATVRDVFLTASCVITCLTVMMRRTKPAAAVSTQDV